MADVTVVSDAFATTENIMTGRNLVWTDKDTGYLFYKDSGNDFVYVKTTDAGANWSASTEIEGTGLAKADVWYDKWTNGDTGTLIHLVYYHTADDNPVYRNLDTSDDSLSTEVIVFNGSSGTEGTHTKGISITKARGGNLYCSFNIDGGTETGFYRSTDAGVNWTSRSNCHEGSQDQFALCPADGADDNDIWSVWVDSSANQLTIKTYDDSANSWGESSGLATIVEETAVKNFEVVSRHSDNAGVLAIQNGTRSSNNVEIEIWEITGTTATQKSSNADTQNATDWGMSLCINQQNDDLYIFYCQGSSGSVAAKYKKSTDDGATWAGETSVSVTSDDHRYITGGTSIGDDGGRIQPVWYNDDLTDMVTNADNGVEITAASAGTNIQLNISDTWKTVSGMQINIGDSWKTITGAQINIGDSWKTIF